MNSRFEFIIIFIIIILKNPTFDVLKRTRRKDVVHVNCSPADDSVIMKPRCVSSSSSGSLESIAQMRVHDKAVLTTRCNTRMSSTWQVVGASCRSKPYAKISYRSTRTPNMPCNVFFRVQ